MSDKTKPSKITKIKRGRTVTEESWVRPWRKRMLAYKAARRELATLMIQRQWTQNEIEHFMKTPQPGLGGRAPKRLVNPKSIGVLMAWARRILGVTG